MYVNVVNSAVQLLYCSAVQFASKQTNTSISIVFDSMVSVKFEKNWDRMKENEIEKIESKNGDRL